MKYNLSLLTANMLFALNYSFFVSVMQSDSLSIGAIYLLQTLLFVLIISPWQLVHHIRVKSPIEPRDILYISLTAVVSSVGWSYATLKGMSLSSPINAAIIASFGPSLTLIFAHMLGRRALTVKRLFGIAISLGGVSLLLFARGLRLLLGHEGSGDILLLVAVFVAAINTLVLKPQLERYGVVRVAFYYSWTAFIASAPLFYGDLFEFSFAGQSVWGMIEITSLLLIGSVLPLLLLFEGAERLSALHTSMYRYVQPFVAAIVILVRGQATLTIYNYIAMLAIILGGLLVASGIDREPRR